MKNWPWLSIVLAFIPAFAGIVVGVIQSRKAIKDNERDLAERRRVTSALSEVVRSMDRSLGFMAADLGIVHPCQDHTFDGWFDVHSMMRDQLLYEWVRKKERSLEKVDPADREHWMLGWTSFHEQSLSRALHQISRTHEIAAPLNPDLHYIEDQLRNRLGITQLKDIDRTESRKLTAAVLESLRGIINRIEGIDMLLRQEKHFEARTKCDAIMQQKHPESNGIDLIIRPSQQSPQGLQDVKM